MATRRTRLAFGMLAAALVAAPTAAIEYRFLDQSALRYFEPADLAMMEETIDAALAGAADGETRAWNNAATGNSGTVTPVESFRRDGNDCRRTRVVNRAPRASEASEAGSVLDLCRIGGAWKIADVPR